jgi:hypothetical protein
MRTHIDSRTSGDDRIMTITLRGTDDDFIGLIDSGDRMLGEAGNLVARIAKTSGLVVDRTSAAARAARLMRRAAEILEQEDDD